MNSSLSENWDTIGSSFNIHEKKLRVCKMLQIFTRGKKGKKERFFLYDDAKFKDREQEK